MIWMSLAHALDPAVVLARRAEVAPLTAQRKAARIPAPTEEDVRKAASGAVVTGVQKVEGHAAKVGWGLSVVDVGIDAFWAALNDETRHGELSALSHVEIVSGSACADGRAVLMVLPLPMIADRFWVNENRYTSFGDPGVRELVWTSVADPAARVGSPEGMAAIDGLVPVGFNKGAWLLVAIDEQHTLAEFTSWVDPGGSVPTGAASLFATAGIEDTFRDMVTYAKKGVLPCRP